MAYVRQQWANAPATTSPLSKNRLDYMEEGIEQAAADADAALAGGGSGSGATFTEYTDNPKIKYNGTAWPSTRPNIPGYSSTGPLDFISYRYPAAQTPPAWAPEGSTWHRFKSLG